jgi:signal transduction histidine kinase/CheY-like chemotaxis protein
MDGMGFKTVIKKNSVQLVIVLAVFLFMIIFGCAWATSNLQHYMVNNAEEMLLVAEERMQSMLRQSEVVLRGTAAVITQMREKGDIDFARAGDYLNVITESFSHNEDYILGFQDLFWFIPGGGGVYVSGRSWPRVLSVPAKALPWYAMAQEEPGKLVITPLYLDFKSQRQIITMAILMVDHEGNEQGYLGIDLDLEKIAEFMVGFDVQGGGYGYLIGPISDADSRLRFMAYPDKRYKDIPLGDLGPQYQALEVQLGKGVETVSSVELTALSGHDVVAFSRRTSNGWYAGLAFPKREYFSNVYTMSVIYGITGLSMMMLLCYFLLRLSLEKMHSDEENKAKSSFLAQVSHEIRTPLNSILGMSEIILRKDISSELYEDVSVIKQAGHILLSIINNILDFSKMETNKVLLEFNPYNPASMLHDVINIARLRLMDKPVDLFVDMDSDVPGELIGDEVKIRQILINLLNNAVKYTKTGYIKLTISGQDVPQAGLGGDQIKLVFSVEDTGVGIKPEDMRYLFKEFTRLDLEHNHDIEGTGLGLTIANSFCRAMGGGINATSSYGRGSVFTAAIIQSYRNPAKVAQLEDPGKRVLVFEDRPAYLHSLLSAFSNLGLQPQCAWDLPAFVRDIQGDKFDYAFIPSRYAAECTASWETSGSLVKLIVMLNSDDMSSSQRVGTVHLPIYSCVLANILNGREADKHMSHSGQAGFIAPTARVLVVDDLPTNLRVAEELMKPYGMKIDTCLSGSEALNLVQVNRYDIVFMDHMMPEMDGLVAADLIRKTGLGNSPDNYYRNLPIVMLTANAVAGQREMFLKNGINDFLAKPIDIGKLNMILKTWLPKEKQEENGSAAETAGPQAETGESVFWGGLPEIPGVDLKTGVKNAGGSVSSYTNILSYFCRDLDERIPQIRQAAADSDLGFYTTMVHAIKGASRSIGAMALGDLAAELEAAGRGRHSDIIAAKTGAFLQKLQELVEYIRRAVESQGEEEAPLDVSKLGLEDLKDALIAMDTGAVNVLLSEFAALDLNRAARKYIADLENHILLFEYDAAIKMIDDELSSPLPGEE